MGWVQNSGGQTLVPAWTDQHQWLLESLVCTLPTCQDPLSMHIPVHKHITMPICVLWAVPHRCCLCQRDHCLVLYLAQPMFHLLALLLPRSCSYLPMSKLPDFYSLQNIASSSISTGPFQLQVIFLNPLKLSKQEL